MISREQARALVEAEIHRPDPYGACGPVEIVEESTIERSWGWVFFYQSSEYLRTGNISAALAGNAPYIVNRHTGDVIVTGTAWPTQKYIDDYESRLLSGV
jgi:hypothetical protein